jgi:capsular polysaccharide biosynthesis protein
VSDADRSVVVPLGAGDDTPEQLPAYDAFADAEERPAADFSAGLVSLGFIAVAIRRSARFWLLTAVVGLLLGVGMYAAAPPTYQASTSLLLTDIVPGAPPGSEILDDQAVAESRTVAGLAVHSLGLRQSVSSFLAEYTVTVVSPRVLLITVSAPSSNDAVSRANAVATAYLGFRTRQLETQQQLVLRSLDQQISQAKQHVKSLSNRISQLSAQSASPAQQAKLSRLQAKHSRAAAALTALETSTVANQAASQTATASQIKNSGVLDQAAPVPHSRLKPLLYHVAIGLIVGLTLGLGIVIVRALMSDRLHRRDDVAHALGAPVKLSVGTVRLSRWRPGRRGLAAARGADGRRIIAHLRNAVPKGSRPAALAVVAVDDPQVAALFLASLAVSCAQEGQQVVLADLATGAPAARLVRANKPGVHAVDVQDAQLMVAVPGSDDVVPAGPWRRTSLQAQPAPDRKLVASCASADLLLTLATLDPAVGGEHLATWAADAVVVVTAGRSSWTKIHVAAEMIRLAGMRLVSAVLVGADQTDESLGEVHPPGADRGPEVREEGLHPDAEGFVVTVDGSPGGGRQETGDRPRR